MLVGLMVPDLLATSSKSAANTKRVSSRIAKTGFAQNGGVLRGGLLSPTYCSPS